jgi:hypothetical protein
LKVAAKALPDLGIDSLNALSEGKDLVRIREHLQRNPGTLNKYDLATNLFLRFVTGLGADGLEVSQRQGKAILDEICLARATKSLEERGKPIFVGSPRNAEIRNALGRFWADPAPNGDFYIRESYDFDTGDPRGTFGKAFPFTLLVGADGTARVVK